MPDSKLFPRGLCPPVPGVRINLGTGSRCLHPLFQPQTPNYLQMVLSWSFPILPNVHTDPTPPLMTPCCLLLREGRGLAQPGCGFFFHCVRPQGPDPCPAARRPHGAATKGHSDPLPVPTSGTMCSPFRGSRNFLPEGELEMGALPLVGEESTSPPTIHRALVFFRWSWS